MVVGSHILRIQHRNVVEYTTATAGQPLSLRRARLVSGAAVGLPVWVNPLFPARNAWVSQSKPWSIRDPQRIAGHNNHNVCTNTLLYAKSYSPWFLCVPEFDVNGP